MQKTWAAAESAFHILGWQGWNVLASLWLCDPSPSMLGTRNNQIFHKSLKRHGKQLAAIWQPQTNKSQNLVAAKNNSNKNKADYYDRAVITDRCGWVNCCKFIISWPSITTTTTVSVVQFTHWSETLSIELEPFTVVTNMFIWNGKNPTGSNRSSAQIQICLKTLI